MQTVILDLSDPRTEALLDARRRTGADRNDEAWEGTSHMNPSGFTATIAWPPDANPR